MTSTTVVEVDIRRGIEGERCTDITAYSGEKRERKHTRGGERRRVSEG